MYASRTQGGRRYTDGTPRMCASARGRIAAALEPKEGDPPAAAPVKSQARPATPEELEAIAQAMHENNGAEIEQEREFLSDASVAVFDDYMTDSPGYVGKVAVAVYAGGPEMVFSCTFDRETGKATVAGRPGGAA